MTPEDQRRVADGAIRFSPYDKSEAGQFIASTLRLDALEVEGVLEELQNTKIIKIVAATRNAAAGTASRRAIQRLTRPNCSMPQQFR
jgi:hypothetical protein